MELDHTINTMHTHHAQSQRNGAKEFIANCKLCNRAWKFCFGDDFDFVSEVQSLPIEKLHLS